MAEKIGEILTRVGLMTAEQVERVLDAQRGGDTRTFGEVATNLGFINGGAISHFLDIKKAELKKRRKPQ